MTRPGDRPGPRQRGLFGPVDEPKETSPKSPVEPAPTDPRADELARALPPKLRMGTSSWSFPGWRGAVYADGAPQRHLSKHGLTAYSQHPLLKAVGLDRTFYAPIAAETYADYAAQVPDDFRFLVKAWAEVTSTTLRGRTGLNPNHLDADCAVDRCVGPAVEGLRGKLGTLLLQFPPQGPEATRRPSAWTERLHAFLDALPKGPRYAVELRDAALFTKDYVDALASAGASHGYVAHPHMPTLAEQRARAAIDGPVTVRWMLRQGLAYAQAKERYHPFDALIDRDPQTRADLAAMAVDAARLDVEMVVVVNNKAEGSSPLSVLELAQQIVQASLAPEARSTSGS